MRQFFLVVMLVVMIAGAMTLYSVLPGTAYPAIIAMAVPALYSLFFNGTFETYVLATVLLMVLGVSIKFTSQMQRVYTDAFNFGEQLKREKEKALKATREKDKYVSLIAHDLKSPFSSLIQLLGLLDSENEPFQGDKKELLKSMKKRCEDSLETIEGVLHASRFTSDQISLNRRFLNSHLEALTALVNFKFQAEKKGIEIVNEVPENMQIYADTQLYGEVLQNLVSNAVKFCTEGDRIILFVPPGEPTTIAVRDTGTGIEQNLLRDIF